jgi:hypothetical protein
MATNAALNNRPLNRVESWAGILRLGLLGFCILFAVSIISLYGELASRVGCRSCGALWGTVEETPLFFWCQLGCLPVPLIVSAVRRFLGGRLLQLYLVGSTLAFLAMAGHFRIPLALTACAAWFWCSTNTVHWAMRRWVSVEVASWELAAASLLALLTMGCTVLATAHALIRPVMVLFTVALAVPGAVDLWRRRSQWTAVWRRRPSVGPLQCVLCEAIWLPLAMTFVWACADEVWSDSTRVHLPHARQMVIEGGLPSSVAGDFFRLMPNAAQTSYAGAAIVSSFRLAKWLSWSALFCLALLVADEVGRACRSRTAYLFAAASLLGCPMLLWEATSLYVDHFATLFTAAAFVVLFRSERLQVSRGFWLSAALIGVAAQVKIQTLVPAAIWCAAVTVLILYRERFSVAVRRLAANFAIFAIFAAPWYVRDWCMTGNPVFPFLNGIFQSTSWPGRISTDFNMEMFRLHGFWQWLMFPWVATFQSSRIVEGYDGWLGCWGLALLPCFFVPTHSIRPTRGLLFSGAAIIVGVSLVAPYLRYWLPGYPLLLIPLIQSAAAAFRRPASRWLSSLAAVPMLACLLLPIAVWIGGWGINDPWLVYTRQKTREQWLADRLPGYNAVDELNGRIDPHDGVICVNYSGVSTVNARAFEFRDMSPEVDHPAGFSDLPGYMRRNHLRYWIVDHTRFGLAFYCGKGCNQYWTDENFVTASQGVAIYDTAPTTCSHYMLPRHHDVPPALVDAGVNRPAWTASTALLKAVGEGAHETVPIDSKLEQTVFRTFTLPLGTGMFRCLVPLRAEQCYSGPGSVRLSVEWFDVQNKRLAVEYSEYLIHIPFAKDEACRHSAGKHGPFVPRESEELACLFSKIPAGAIAGAVSITTFNTRVWIQTACFSFWQVRPEVAATVSGSKGSKTKPLPEPILR